MDQGGLTPGALAINSNSRHMATAKRKRTGMGSSTGMRKPGIQPLAR